MSASINHPSFAQPKDSIVKLWQYLDFTKYVSLLETSSLFLSRADLLGDPFEGSYSKANKKLRNDVYKNLEQKARDNYLKFTPEFAKWIRQWMYINCWHMNDSETAAMWKLYAKSNEAVAIQTIYSKLVDALPNKINIGLVQYIDYEKEWLPEGYAFYPFMHKRKSFFYEKEVRIIKSELPVQDDKELLKKTNNLLGIYRKINLDELIDNVYVAPTAPKWFYDLVKHITNKYGINKAIRYSGLDKDPVY